MMFGKYIFGTSEAFVGFDSELNDIGTLCNTKEEFIHGINSFLESNNEFFFSRSRQIFKNKYDINSSDELFEKMINAVKKDN